MAAKALKIDSLDLDLENPRITLASDQRDAMQKILDVGHQPSQYAEGIPNQRPVPVLVFYNRFATRAATALPKATCWLASKWIPSTRLAGVTLPASKKWQSIAEANSR